MGNILGHTLLPSTCRKKNYVKHHLLGEAFLDFFLFAEIITLCTQNTWLILHTRPSIYQSVVLQSPAGMQALCEPFNVIIYYAYLQQHLVHSR